MRFPIVKNRRIFYTVSIILTLASIIGVFTLGLNLSLHFTGGVQNTYSFTSNRPGIEEFKQAILDEEQAFNATSDQDVSIGTPVIIPSGNLAYNVRYRIAAGSTEEASLYTAFNKQLSEKLAATVGAKEDATFTISPSAGDVLKTNAIWATIIACIAIMIYIALAFRKIPKEYNSFIFGLSTLIGLFHDVVILVGIFVVLGHVMHAEVGPYFITAILTILGYSINDSIVVLDRVRDTMTAHKGRVDIEKTVEESVWGTMARSINTSLTVLITLGALLFFGAESTQMFVLALFLGVIIGTYSSIFISSPLLVTWKKYLIKK